MPAETEHLILAQLRGLRQEFAVAIGTASTALTATQRVAAKLDQVLAELAALRDEVTAARAEARGGLATLERDLLHLERQNVARHGEALSTLWAVGELDRRTADLERQLAAGT